MSAAAADTNNPPDAQNAVAAQQQQGNDAWEAALALEQAGGGNPVALVTAFHACHLADPTNADKKEKYLFYLKPAGDASLNGGNFAAAVAFYSNAIAAAPTASLHSDRSYAYYRSGQFPNARADALLAVGLDATFAPGHLRLATAEVRLHNYQASQAAFLNYFANPAALPDPEATRLIVNELAQGLYGTTVAAARASNQDPLTSYRGRFVAGNRMQPTDPATWPAGLALAIRATIVGDVKAVLMNGSLRDYCTFFATSPQFGRFFANQQPDGSWIYPAAIQPVAPAAAGLPHPNLTSASTNGTPFLNWFQSGTGFQRAEFIDIFYRAQTAVDQILALAANNATRIMTMDGHGRFTIAILILLHHRLPLPAFPARDPLDGIKIELVDTKQNVVDAHGVVFSGPGFEHRRRNIFDLLPPRNALPATTFLFFNFCGIGEVNTNLADLHAFARHMQANLPATRYALSFSCNQTGGRAQKATLAAFLQGLGLNLFNGGLPSRRTFTTWIIGDDGDDEDEEAEEEEEEDAAEQ
jgi:hypothetical protein